LYVNDKYSARYFSFIGSQSAFADPYQSLSGVKKEMRWAVPLEIGAAGAGLSIWLGLLIV